jgi:hypothetical protein
MIEKIKKSHPEELNLRRNQKKGCNQIHIQSKLYRYKFLRFLFLQKYLK